MGGRGSLDASTIARDQRVAVANDLNDVPVEQNASILHATSESRLQSNDYFTLQTLRASRACYFRQGRLGGIMTSSFERVRVLWPDHLGLARGKYVPASLADHGARHCTGTWALGYDRAMTPETHGQLLERGAARL